tara:strand:- start:216 stop:665 length:450 start_codon:yes stop_codon:yes gene_type:complete
MGPTSRYETHKALEKAHKTITLSLKFYLDNKKLLGSADDLAIGVSNIMNTDITDIGIIALAKSLNGHRRTNFLRLVAESEFDDADQVLLRLNKLSDDCKPWLEVFKDVKNKSTEIDRQIIEYEIANLYLNTITEGKEGFIKKINLELAW